MIAEQYINEGLRIRKIYIKNLKEILKQEPILMNRKEKFQKLQDSMGNIVNSDLNEVRKTIEINEKLLILEKELRDIQNIIKPYYNEIEKLRNDKDRLYMSIREKYPNITDEQIENEIMSKVEE